MSHRTMPPSDEPSNANATTFDVAFGVPLTGELDLEPVSRLPRDHWIKGLFFERCVRALGSRWPAVARELSVPPEDGRYVAFDSYPLRDYFQVFVAAARAHRPSSSPREAVRLFAHDEVNSFAATMLGRVTLSLLGDPAAALLRYPETFGVLASGLTARAKRASKHQVDVELRGSVGPMEYAVGVMEGVVLAFRRRPRVAGESAPARTRLSVRWTE